MRELGQYSAILTVGMAQSLLSRVVNSVIVLMLINVIVDNVNANVVNEDNSGQVLLNQVLVVSNVNTVYVDNVDVNEDRNVNNLKRGRERQLEQDQGTLNRSCSV
jgi:formiminotetrahydrofolate cyclodeaminase